MNVSTTALSHSPVSEAEPVTALVHCLTLPLAGGLHIEEASRRIAALRAAGISAWVEPLAFGLDHPTSRRLIAREERRPVAGLRGRAVLFRAPDGAAELTFVASQRQMGLPELRALIVQATAGSRVQAAGLSGVTMASGAEVADWAMHPVDWGLGDAAADAGQAVVALDDSGLKGPDRTACLIAAAGVLLARYGHPTPAIPVLFVGQQDRPQLGLAFASTEVETDAAAFVPSARVLQPLRLAAGADLSVGFGLRLTEICDGERYQWAAPAPFGISLDISVARTEPLAAQLTYDRRLLAPAIAAEVADQLVALARDLAARRLTGPARAARVLTAARAAEILALGDRSALAAEPATIPALFDRAAALAPEAVALEAEDGSLTYAQLQERSQRFAAALAGLGVASGDRVGLSLPRCADLIVCMLAIARLGAAYVPMDPAYPAERLQFTAEDAGLRLVVAGEDGFPATEGVRCVAVDDLARSVVDPVPLDASVAVSPDALAYVIYTSGSTGRPKGVAIPHRNVAALIGATRDSMALGPQDVWTFFHSAAFDFSVWEIWGALLTGGRLIVVPYWVSRDPEAFHELLGEKGVTVLNQTPSAFYALQEADARRPALRRLRLVIFGGEALNARALVDWYRRYPSPICRTINMFGITETTVHVTIRDITPALALVGSRTVGGALPGWSISVRNAAGEVQPLGVPGEIYVGGAGLAMGYLNRPDLTQDRFVQDPVTGTRQYRSGDLGRMHPDGALDHLGRIDSQVKIRGFRIELDEVRAVVQAVEGVRAAAVVVAEAVEGDGATARLDAYVVLEDWMKPDRLRNEIAGVLPAYMMPARIVPVEKLALTVNGKLDVKSLRAAVTGETAKPVAPVAPAPSDALNTMLAIWQGCFAEPVKPGDDFFHIGGNSIMAVKLTSEVRKALGVSLSLRDLFLNPTPERLVEHLARQPAAV